MSRILFAAQSEYLSVIPDKECVALISFFQWDINLFLYGMWRGFIGFSQRCKIRNISVCDCPVCPQRPTADSVLRDGHLSLSGLQMRAHAMFSAQGLPLGSDTLEYAWLIDMQAGGLTGRVTVPQVGVCGSSKWTVWNVEG